MRYTSFLIPLGLIGLLSCQAGNNLPTDPGTPLPPPLPTATYALQEGGDSLVGMFRIHIDPDTLAATVTAQRQATAQPPQAQRYDLDIANFQNPDSLRITGVQVLGSGNYRVTFTHAHPFPAPDIAQPATGMNRADLGYTGRLVLLTQYNPQSFFSNAVRLSAGAVVNPDGYVETGDLLANVGPALVTAYPYKLLADEAQDNRTGVSNGGDPEGSYASSAGGWQRVNLGSAGTGWTGFDYVHGGQTITNLFDLSRDALSSSSFTFDAALLIQYTDPRGAGGPVNRLPAAAIDVSDFAYRLPYAALDCSRITMTNNFTVGPSIGNSSPLTVRVRDWDAMAAEAPDATVGDESDVSLVQAGGAGTPEVILDAPGILLGLRNMGTPTGSGYSNDLLTFTNIVVNQVGAAPGLHWACLRMEDPEFSDTARENYHLGVDPHTLVPSAARGIRARTWQIVPITIGPALPVVTSVVPSGVVGAVGTMATFAATVEGSFQSLSWNFGGGAIPNASSATSPEVQLAFTSGVYTGTVTATNAGGDSTPFEFTLQVLPAQVPQILGGGAVNLTTNSIPLQPTHNAMLIYQGRPVVAYLFSNAGLMATGLTISLANVPLPEGPEDWTSYEISADLFGIGVSMAEIAGRIALLTSDRGTSEELQYVVATVPDPGPADWTWHRVRGGGGVVYGRQQALVEYRGRPALIALRSDNNATYYYRSDQATPTSSVDWSGYQVDATAARCTLAVVEAHGVERLVMASVIAAEDFVELGVSSVDEPASLAGWVVASPSVTDPTTVELIGMNWGGGKEGFALFTGRNGAPTRFLGYELDMVGNRTLMLQYNLELSPTGSDWPTATVLNGRLAVAVSDGEDSSVTFCRARSPLPGPRDWDYLTATSRSHSHPNLDAFDNRLVLFSLDQSFPWQHEFRYTDSPW